MERCPGGRSATDIARFFVVPLATALLVSVLSARPATAAACTDLQSIDRVESLIHAMAHNDSDPDRIRSFGIAVRQANTEAARSSASPELKRQIELFLASRRTALALYEDLGAPSLREFLASERSRAAYANVAARLKGQDCAETTSQKAPHFAGHAARPPPTYVAGAWAEKAKPALLAVGAILLFGLGAFAWTRHDATQQRRTRRYICNFPAELRTEAEQFRVVVLDISELGAKVAAPAPLPPDTTTWIRLNGAWRRATIIWNSSNYAGLEFKSPLRPFEASQLGHAQE